MAKKIEKEVKSKKPAVSAEFKKLKAAIDDINENMGIEGLDTESLTEAEIRESLKELETQIPSDDEVLSKETWEVLKELDLECARVRFAESSKKTKKSAKVEESEDEDSDDSDEDKKPAKKASKVKEDSDEDEDDAPAKKTKKSTKAEEPEDEDAPKKKGPKKAGGVGVIASIPEILKAAPKTGISLEDIAKQLHKKFPDREVSSLLGTVKVQVSSRLKKEKGIEVIAVSKGFYKL
jgi:hypothetical protein